MRAAMRQDRDIAGLEPDFATVAGIQQTSAKYYGIKMTRPPVSAQCSDAHCAPNRQICWVRMR